MKGELPQATQRHIIGLSAGYLSLQITYGIESAGLSRIYQGFGAGVEDPALLWLANPVSELLVQLMIGRLSYRTCLSHLYDLATRNLDERRQRTLPDAGRRHLAITLDSQVMTDKLAKQDRLSVSEIRAGYRLLQNVAVRRFSQQPAIMQIQRLQVRRFGRA